LEWYSLPFLGYIFGASLLTSRYMPIIVHVGRRRFPRSIEVAIFRSGVGEYYISAGSIMFLQLMFLHTRRKHVFSFQLKSNCRSSLELKRLHYLAFARVVQQQKTLKRAAFQLQQILTPTKIGTLSVTHAS